MQLANLSLAKPGQSPSHSFLPANESGAHMFKDNQQLKKSSQILKVLGNFYRLQIVTLLLNGEKNVSELNQSVKVSQPALSQHLSKLRREGVLGARREQRQIFYYINNPHVIRVLGVVSEMTSGVPAPATVTDAKKVPARA
jgi:DNA-binding transcriptional ArsR family regulator